MQYQTVLSLQSPLAFSTPARASSTASSRGGSSGESTAGGPNNSGKGKLSHRQRAAANQRERRRMTSLNMAFDVLRRYLPEGRAKEQNTKKPISKVETLRHAIDYIAKLQGELDDFDADNGFSSSLIPVQGQLVRQLPDEVQQQLPCYPHPTPNSSISSVTTSLPSGPLMTPPVYCFGGMVQHSQSSISNRRLVSNAVSIAPDYKFNFRFQYNNNDGCLTPSSSSSSFPSPQPPCSFGNNFATMATPFNWYC